MKKFRISKNSGFTLIEVLITTGIVSVFIAMAMQYSVMMGRQTQRVRNVSTQNRVLSGIRELARMPATLRASMRASYDGVAVNPQLLACAGGATPNGCQNGVEFPFTMFSPIFPQSPSGQILGVQPISAPLGSSQPMRINSYGAPCVEASSDCALLIYTSFKAQCGPPQVAALPTTITADQLLPAATCTVADVIAVTYYVQLDSSMESTDPGLASFVNQSSGTVTVSVRAISGNKPQ